MSDSLLTVYDTSLRFEAEAIGALRWDTDGPLMRAVFDGGYGFISYRSLAGYDGAALDDLITATVAYFTDEADVTEVEWKTRGHDHPADLGERLVSHGFVAGEVETVMMGRAADLAHDVPLPPGIRLRQIGFTEAGEPETEDRVRADIENVLGMQREIFGTGARQSADELVRRVLDSAQQLSFWVAETVPQREVVSAGRLEIVPGTSVAGLWGGATLPPWRGRGIYRALTAQRARAALDHGIAYLHSDCTEDSRPILQRSGMVAITTSTPYVWTRPGT